MVHVFWSWGTPLAATAMLSDAQMLVLGTLTGTQQANRHQLHWGPKREMHASPVEILRVRDESSGKRATLSMIIVFLVSTPQQPPNGRHEAPADADADADADANARAPARATSQRQHLPRRVLSVDAV